MKQIKHLRIFSCGGTDPYIYHYICNHRLTIKENRCTWNEKEVTCKNCLKKLQRNTVYIQTKYI